MSNARFVKKSFHLDVNTLNALDAWVKKGGTITVVKSAKRPKNGYNVGKHINVKG